MMRNSRRNNWRPTRKGWGHSTWKEGMKWRARLGAGMLVLFHHDPDSSDRAVDHILRQSRQEFDSVFAASEGMVITLGGDGERVQAHMPGTRTALRREAQFRGEFCGVTEGGRPFEEETLVRDLSLQGAMISLKHRAAVAVGVAGDDGNAGAGRFADDAAAGLCGED